MSMDTVRATLREEIDDQVAEHGSWDHGRVVAATVARLHPFTHLDLADVVGYAVRNLAYYEAVQDAFTTIGEVVDLDAVAAAERRAA